MKKSDAIVNLEHEILEILAKTSKHTFHFETYVDGQYVVTDIYSKNPINKELFLMYSVQLDGGTYEGGLMRIKDYVQRIANKEDQHSYTVKWVKKGTHHEKQKSYFYCHNILELADKFYRGKNPDDYIIESIELNPIY